MADPPGQVFDQDGAWLTPPKGNAIPMYGYRAVIIRLLTAATSNTNHNAGLTPDGLRWLLFGLGVLAIVGVGWLLTRRK